jgi:hypothetical protein
MRNDDNHKGPKPFSVCFIIGLLLDIPELETQENDIEAAEQHVNSDVVALLNFRVRICSIGSSPDVEPQSCTRLCLANSTLGNGEKKKTHAVHSESQCFPR